MQSQVGGFFNSLLDSLAREHDYFVITAPLDDFLGEPGQLEWRGIRMESVYTPTSTLSGTQTAGYVVNHPSVHTTYTRTVETKHATGQRVLGTVVSREFPGASGRHYPVPTLDTANERRNRVLQRRIRALSPRPVLFRGRLATYAYINQDEAVAQGLAVPNDLQDLM